MLERDPISGNEVPPGAEPKEVRDDINAKLSDGEYVLPADVVRYFGVAHIEKMVQKAKEGMSEMAAAGRINGQDPRQKAVPNGDPAVRKFSAGGYNGDPEYGFMPQAPLPGEGPAVMDGYSAQEELRRRQEAPVQMADGGMYDRAARELLGGQGYGTAAQGFMSGQPGFDASRWTFGRPAGGSFGGAGGVETRSYINSAGEYLPVMFINGTPISDIPDGFFPDTEETRRMFAEQNTRGEDVADPSQQWDEDGRDSAESNGRNKPDPYSTADTNPFTMSPEQAMDRAKELAKTAAGGGIMEGLGKVPGTIGAVAGTLGKVGQVNAFNELKSLTKAINQRGGLGIAEELDGLIAEVASDVPTPKKDSWMITPEDKYLEKFKKGLGKVPYQQAVDNYPGITGEGGQTPPTNTTSGGQLNPPGVPGTVPDRTPAVNRYNIAPGQQWTLDSPYQKVSGGHRATEDDVRFLENAGAKDLRVGDQLTDIETAMLHNRDAGLSLSNDAGLDRAQAIRDIQRATNTTPTWGDNDRERSWEGGGVAGEEGSRATSQSAPSPSRTAEEARAAAQRAADDLGVGLATGGRAKGGLVSRKHAYRVPRRKIRTVEK